MRINDSGTQIDIEIPAWLGVLGIVGMVSIVKIVADVFTKKS